MEWLEEAPLLKTDNRRPETTALIDFLVEHNGQRVIGRPTGLIRVSLGELKRMLRWQATLMSINSPKAQAGATFEALLPMPE